MRTRSWLAFAFVAALAALPLLAAAQQQPAPAPAPTAAPTPAPAPAQEPAPASQQPTFRTGVDLVTVDVAVVDSRGNPVEDLRAPDFAVKIDGQVRRVVSAELVKVDVEKARRQTDDKTETFYTSNLTPDNGRHIVIAVDQINISHGALQPIMAAAQRFLDRLSPLDQVAFIAYPEPGPRVNFTSDKLKLRLAMQALIGQAQRVPSGQQNIGVTEALAIYNRRDQIVLADVVARECRGLNPTERAQCERDIITQSAEIARRVREDADFSVNGLRRLLQELSTVEGHKSLILLTEGLAVEDQNELASLASLAGQARTSINVLVLDLRRGDVTISEQPPTEQADRRLQLQGLEGLATMSLGSLFYIAGTGEPIFERLSSEISAYYLLGVEERPSDREGNRHRVDVEVRRRGVTIRSRQAFVLSSGAPSRKSPAERLRDTLTSPFSVPGVPLRVATFAHQDPAGDNKVRLTIAAQVGQPGAAKGEFMVGFILISPENKVAASWGNKVALSPLGSSANEPLAFEGSTVVDPGIYSLRVGVVDEEGRRGSVVREVSAWKMSGEALAFGDLVVGNGGSGVDAARGGGTSPERRSPGRVSRALLERAGDVRLHGGHGGHRRRRGFTRPDQPGRPRAARLQADDAHRIRRDAALPAAARPLRRACPGPARRQGNRCAGAPLRPGAGRRGHGRVGHQAHGCGQGVCGHAAPIRPPGGSRARLRGGPAGHRREAVGHVEGCHRRGA